MCSPKQAKKRRSGDTNCALCLCTDSIYLSINDLAFSMDFSLSLIMAVDTSSLIGDSLMVFY